MAVSPNEIHPALTGMIQQVVANSPGKLLSAPDRYALSVIADGQADRISSDEFAKSAAQGVSPDAHAANKAADSMAAAIGIVPPPESPVPMAPSAGQGTQSNPGYQDSASTGEMPGVQPNPTPNAPPGTYFNSTTGRTEWSPHYHGPYTTIAGSMIDQDAQNGVNVAGGSGGFVSQPTGGSIPPATLTGTEAKGPEVPTHQFAPLDQQSIDHAWQMFDLAMQRQPVPKDPAKMPEIGLAQVIAMAAAGLINPQAGAVIGKALFEAPVMAKQLMDEQNDKSYSNEVKAWQTETQRLQFRANSVQNSEVAQQKNLQGTYDKDFEAKMTQYTKVMGQQASGLRKLDQDLTGQINKIMDLRANGKLSPEDNKQYTDQLNNLIQQQSAIRGEISGVLTGAPSTFFDAEGKPTAAYTKMQSDIAMTEQKITESGARITRMATLNGLTEEQALKIKTLLPAEFDRMTAQTANYSADRVKKIWQVLDLADQMANRDFRSQLASDQFMFGIAKTKAGLLDSEMKFAHKEFEDATKAAQKEQTAADKIKIGALDKQGEWIDPSKKAEYEAHIAAAQKAQKRADELSGPDGALSRLQNAHDTIQSGFDDIKQRQAPSGGGTTYSAVEGQVNAGTPKTGAVISFAQSQIGKPYVWGGGRSDSDSFDCSGLIINSRKQAGLPDIGSTAQEMYTRVPMIEKGTLPQAGDLIFYDWNNDGHVDHVVLYAGNGKVIEASSSKGKVIERNFDPSRNAHLAGIGRPDSGLQTSGAPTAPEPRKPRGKASANASTGAALGGALGTLGAR